MRICEVRRHLQYFVVYVNDARDIQKLRAASGFKQLAKYSSNKKIMGVEYVFDCTARTIVEAKAHVQRIIYGKS